MGALYQVSDLLVVPSRYEPSGVSLLEARLHDLPVVCTDCPQITELIKTLGIRYVVTPDPDRLASGVLDALKSTGSVRRDTIPRNKRIPEEWCLSRIAERAASLYGHLSAEHGSP